MYLTKCDKSVKYSYTRKVTLTRGFLKVLLETKTKWGIADKIVINAGWQ